MTLVSRRSRMLVVGVLMAVAVGGGCGDDAGPPSESSTTAGKDSLTTTAPADEPVLVGTWRTDPITPADAEATLTGNGLDEWIDEFTPLSPLADSPSLVLEIGDAWDLSAESADGALVPVDFDASYEIDGDEVTVTHSEGSNTFRWVVAGDVLTLEWLNTTLPDFQEVPEEVFQRVLYQTAGFTRAA